MDKKIQAWKHRRVHTAVSGWWGLLALSCTLGPACTADPEASPPGSTSPESEISHGEVEPRQPGEGACFDARTTFEEEIYPQVLAPSCLECHSEIGIAADYARLVLEIPRGTQSMERNYEIVLSLAGEQDGDRWLLLAKPLGEISHGGGQVLEASSDEAALLEDWLTQLNDASPCDNGLAHADGLEPVEMLSNRAALRRVALQLAGRMPTDEELDSVEGDDAALQAAVEALLDEPALEGFVHTTWNDRLHTWHWSWKNGNKGVPARILFRKSAQYPEYDDIQNGLGWDYEVSELNSDLGEETTRLIWYQVSNDLPFSGVLDADYSLMSPPIAQMMNAEMVEADWAARQATLNTREDWQDEPTDEWEDYPHAGVMTTTGLLARWPSNEGNLHRAQAALLLDVFLDININTISSRPADLDASTYAIPEVEDASCAVCHRVLDPVAASLGVFSNNGRHYAHVNDAAEKWSEDLWSPGLLGAEPPEDLAPRELPGWLGSALADHPNFPWAVASVTWAGLIGEPPLAYPLSSTAADHDDALRSWYTQQGELETAVTAFIDSGDDYKALIAAIVMSPSYRTSWAAGDLSDGVLGGAGIDNPERIRDRLHILLGSEEWDVLDALDEQLMLGGINSETVLDRYRQPNVLAAGILENLANEAACTGVADDFERKAADRLLFSRVERTDPLPADVATAYSDDPDVVDTVRALYWRLLGLELADGDPELERGLALLLAVAVEGQVRVEDGDESKNVIRACRTDSRNDELYTQRAWTALLTYLLTDPRFFTL